MAVINEHLPVVSLFSENTEQMNPRNSEGTTPLHIAVDMRNLQTCQKILETNGEEKNPKDKNGRTPLHEAAKNGYVEICEKIIESVQ